MSEINELQEKIKDFADRREWRVFHTPKNLVMALSGEIGELTAEFQWLTPEESFNLENDKKNSVSMEIADVAIYLLRLCAILEIDLNHSILTKVAINEKRFPEIREKQTKEISN